MSNSKNANNSTFSSAPHTLVICEKPSVAQSVSAVLNAKQRRDGFTQGEGFIVTWCYGHLVDLAEPAAYGEQYKRWSRSLLPILPEKWKYTASADKKKQLDVIRSLMNRTDVETVICATDAGREGELIFRLVYDFCKCKKPVQRLWISSLEDSAIRKGFDSLRPGSDFDNLYYCALCRSQADWAVGINITRLYSCLYGPTLPVGRVQTPTLAMIVEREKAILAFVSEPFYTPMIDCGQFNAFGEKREDSDAAEAVRIAADGKDACVLRVEKARKTSAPPKLYDLTSLQRDANKIYGFTAQQTLDYTQSLYEAKLVTYPRTDSQYLTDDMGGTAKSVIAALSGVYKFAGALSGIDGQGESGKQGSNKPFIPDIARVTNNAKVSDHHAIIPTMEIAKKDLSSLPSGERNVLALIALRLLCATAPVHHYETVTAILECGGYQFTAKGKTSLTDGWRAFETAFRDSFKKKPDKSDDNDDSNDTDDDENGALPNLTEGQIFPSVKASVREGKTKPPARFTEATLLRAMETAGD